GVHPRLDRAGTRPPATSGGPRPEGKGYQQETGGRGRKGGVALFSAMRLNRATLKTAVDALCISDPDLAEVVSRYGYPPLWGRKPGFATLIRIILEQQVSLASARAMYRKLLRHLGEVTPE